MSRLVSSFAGLVVVTAFGMTPTLAAAADATANVAESAVQFVDLIADQYSIRSNVTYATANNVELKLDLYLPRNATSPVPLVINFHGGGWVEGSKEGSALWLMRYLQMGFAVANVGYRLGRVSPAPAAVEDTRCALRWLTRRAKDLKVDTGKIVLTGGSAGGHLALITGMLAAGNPFDRACATDDSTRWVNGTEPPLRVAAIINYFGITDVEDMLSGPNAKHYAIEWLGAAPNREVLAKSLSPIHYVRAGLPAIFTVHGDADQLVPYAHSIRLHEALGKAGVTNEMLTVPGGGHGGFPPAESLRISAAIRAFLARQGIVAMAR